MTNPTLLDIAKSQGSDGLAGLIEEVLPACPELKIGAARGIKGTKYEQNVRTSLPGVAFRSANEGTATTKSGFVNRLFECFIMNPIWQCDQAVANAHEDGAAAYIAAEGIGMTKGAMVTVCKQFYYGLTLGDAKGFPGLLAMYDSANMTVDATGTTASTGSSVWMVKFGPEGVQWLWGNDKKLDLSEVKEIVAYDDSNNPYDAYHQSMLAWAGLKQSSLNAVGRIKNITEDSLKGLTDKLLGKLLSKFKVELKPDAIFMTRRSLEQLRSSRTATNATGAEAPTPTTFEGITIYPTDSILDTEAIA